MFYRGYPKKLGLNFVYLKDLRFIDGILVPQTCTPRLPKDELANIPRIFQEYPRALGAKPLISNSIPTIFLEYLPIQSWGALGYMAVYKYSGYETGQGWTLEPGNLEGRFWGDL